MMTLAACMIVKNEAEHLAGCLESLCDAVNEIVILDTGSSDATLEIARRFTPHVHSSERFDADTKSEDFHFADARNEAKRYATADWLLSIDADERLEAGDLRGYLGGATADVACLIVECDSETDEHTFTGRSLRRWSRSPRMMRNNGTIWQYRIHEVPKHPDTNIGPTIPKHVASLYHVSIGSDVRRAHHQRNLALCQRELRDSRQQRDAAAYGHALYELGASYVALKCWPEAVGAFVAFLAGAKGISSTHQALTRELLAGACLQVTAPTLAERWAREALVYEPQRIDAWMILALSLKLQGRFADAINAAIAAQSLPQPIRHSVADDDAACDAKWLTTFIADCRKAMGYG